MLVAKAGVIYLRDKMSDTPTEDSDTDWDKLVSS